MLAMLRVTNTSPGFKPRMVVSGQRESEQPIQRRPGDWPWASLGKYSALLEEREWAQDSLQERACWKGSVLNVVGLAGFYGWVW